MLPRRPGWSWHDIRSTGLAWWLLGRDAQSLELTDLVVTKLAQSSMAKLRSPSTTWDKAVWGRAPTEEPGVARKLAVDEAFFWSVVLGATMNKLRALVRTGLFREANGGSGAVLQGLAALLQHAKAEEPQFLRKNAFRLLELHRFHLASALFLLSGSCEEACRVLSKNLRDLQLALLVARKHPEVTSTLVLDKLDSLERDSRSPLFDPWLRLLLAYHANDPLAAQLACNTACAKSDGCVAEASPPSAETVVLFDNSLRMSVDAATLPRVAEQLFSSK